jgi:hypothetical protein
MASIGTSTPPPYMNEPPASVAAPMVLRAT